MPKPLPTPEQLSNAMSYNQSTGLFLKRNGKPALSTDHGNGYLSGLLMGKRIFAQRAAFVFMTGGWPPHQVDHRNMIRSDNRWANLRSATRAENMRNSGSRHGGISRFKGVCPSQRGKPWRSYIVNAGKQTSLGAFDSEEDAARAYDNAARVMFGRFAWLNFS